MATNFYLFCYGMWNNFEHFVEIIFGSISNSSDFFLILNKIKITNNEWWSTNSI